ncbi:hypothetical protein BJ322DRAFT_1104419 [Thelephora terrestris]|uniref:Uncharacterized protein n=1 Tax=Thelephora terrestris TaxID=56493 RepID=A0A9P6HP71_9AGAM|nr:hypothetical protein BJ322DRAFT_1104419 [Thelephora terrestris]
MNRGDRPEKRNNRHSPYERITLPDPMQKDLARYISSNSSPLRGAQPSRQVDKSRASKSSPFRVKKEPVESDFQLEREGFPDNDVLELSSDSNEDNALLAASRKLAHDQTVYDQRKNPKALPMSMERRPVNQQMAGPSSSALAQDKGSREAPRYGHGAVPSSLSIGPSSATWTSRPSEDPDHGSDMQAVDLEQFAAEMTSLIDEFCVRVKSKVEELANRGH